MVADGCGFNRKSTAYSTALLALRRFGRRSLKQMSAGLISLLLIWGVTVQGADTPMNAPRIDGLSAASSDVSLVKNRAGGEGQLAVVSAVLPDGDKPFQVLRPKMTNHRLTTSRLSIPSADQRVMASLSETGLGERE